MEEKKIFKLGNSSFVFTLPSAWIKLNKFDTNSKVYLRSTSDKLIIFPKKDEILKEYEQIVIKFQKPIKFFAKKFMSAYFKNYRSIVIVGDNLNKELPYIKSIISEKNSLQICEVSNEKIVLKDFTNVETLDVFSLINMMVNSINSIFNEIRKEELSANIINEIDITINKISYLAFKCLNYNLQTTLDRNFVVNSVHYWRIVFALESLADILKRIGRYLIQESENYTPELKKIIVEIQNYFNSITRNINSKKIDKKNISNYLDEKQSLLKEIEEQKRFFDQNLNIYLVVTQMVKDLIGKLELVVVSLVDFE